MLVAKFLPQQISGFIELHRQQIRDSITPLNFEGVSMGGGLESLPWRTGDRATP